MGGPLSWDQRAFDHRASHVYGGVPAAGIGAVGGLADVKEGCLVRAFVEEVAWSYRWACLCVREETGAVDECIIFFFACRAGWAGLA